MGTSRPCRDVFRISTKREWWSCDLARPVGCLGSGTDFDRLEAPKVKPIVLTGYTVTDPYFGARFIDEDTEGDMPVAHRMIHGGFEGDRHPLSLPLPE